MKKLLIIFGIAFLMGAILTLMGKPPVLGVIYTAPTCFTTESTSTPVYLNNTRASTTITCASDGSDRIAIQALVTSTTTTNTLQYEVQYSQNNQDWFSLWRLRRDINGDPQDDSIQATTTIWLATTTPIFKLPIRSGATTTFVMELPQVPSRFTRIRFNIHSGDAAFWAARIDHQPK